MSKKRLYIVSAQPGGNKGAEAMLETMIQQILALPHSEEYEIWIETLSNSSVYGEFCDRLGIPHNLFLFSPRNISAYDIDPKPDDVMIDIGGINYTDKSTITNLRNYRRHAFFIKKKMRLLYFTQDFGPARKPITKLLGRRVMSRADHIFSRSPHSLAMLKELLPDANVSGPHPDCTLVLAPTPPPRKPEGRYVTLVPSAIMMNDHGERYLDFMTKIGEALPENITPIVLAHNFTANGATFDTVVCDALHERLSKSRTTMLFKDPWTPSELKGLLKDADAVITSRFHAMVGAMSSNVPAFAIGWSHKYQEFMALYGKDDLSYDMRKLPEDAAGVVAAAQDVVARSLNVAEEERAEFLGINAKLRSRVQTSFRELSRLLQV